MFVPSAENIQDAPEHPYISRRSCHVVPLVLIYHLRGSIHSGALLLDFLQKFAYIFLSSLRKVNGMIFTRRSEVSYFETWSCNITVLRIADEDVFDFDITMGNIETVYVFESITYLEHAFDDLRFS